MENFRNMVLYDPKVCVLSQLFTTTADVTAGSQTGQHRSFQRGSRPFVILERFKFDSKR